MSPDLANGVRKTRGRAEACKRRDEHAEEEHLARAQRFDRRRIFRPKKPRVDIEALIVVDMEQAPGRA